MEIVQGASVQRPELRWEEIDSRCVDTARLLAADAVQNSSGHAGTAMSLAPVAYLLYQKVMRSDPRDVQWDGRDRFVLSAGHASLLQYIQLYLGGFGLELQDLKELRRWGSKTPGHPEYKHTDGVEVTTGPLGQGLANAVGMAMAARRERGLLDPDAPAGASPFDHSIYVIASDGDIEEGVTSEASSLAGHLQLGNLIVIYDDNGISIEDDTRIALSEDVVARYSAYGWHTQTVDFTNNGGAYQESVEELFSALQAAKEKSDQPSLISLKTIIGWPAPNLQNTAKAHGSKLGDEEIRSIKETLGFPSDQAFYVSNAVLEHTRALVSRAERLREEWDELFLSWQKRNPTGAELLQRLKLRHLPDGWSEHLPSFASGEISTRKASGEVLTALAPILPELWGGSADLADSNNTYMKGELSFGPAAHQTSRWRTDLYGRSLHFGIREHAMAAAINGIVVHGGTRAYGGTFLTFSDYMRPAVRLAALMKIPSIFIWTHDSIGVGEDGPTHQPVEHLASLRAIPGLSVVRPADANEAAFAWRGILEDSQRPSGLILSRQDLPVLADVSNSTGSFSVGDPSGVLRGGYVLVDVDGGLPDALLLATGSEVHVALHARELLLLEGIRARVISMPCLEWFADQDAEYRESVLPSSVRARVSIEAGISMGWKAFVGDAGESVSVESFGASADPVTLFQHFGVTPQAIVEAAKRSLASVSDTSPGGTGSAGLGGGTADEDSSRLPG